MARLNYKRAFVILCSALSLAGAVHYFNLPGRVAFALEKAVIQAVNDQLPTAKQMDELARVNRLVARKALPAVVHIVTTTQAAEPQHPAIPDIPEEWRRFFEIRPRRNVPRVGQGSGVIIDAEQGYILTNNHVVGEANEIQVRLSDGRRFDGQLIGHDPPTDLAVIQIDADQLFELSIGDSDVLEVGDPVMTIGNPFGLEGTVSKGIVSAKDRSQLGIIDYEGFIQTDAVINPGNSGGPLVNMRAEIVGINTAIETVTGSFSGVGLAIPSSRAKRVLPSLLKGEKIVRGYLGVQIISAKDDPTRAQALSWNQTSGVIVTDVLADSPADEAGLKAGDILITLNNELLTTSGDLTETIAYTPPGSTVVFDIWRDEHSLSLQVVIGRQPEGFSTRPGRFVPQPEDEPEPTSETVDIPELGLQVETLNRQFIEKYHLKDVADRGVVVTEVTLDSEADDKNIKPGEVIVSVNGNKVRDIDEFSEWYGKADPEVGIDLRLRNHKGSRHVRLYPEK